MLSDEVNKVVQGSETVQQQITSLSNCKDSLFVILNLKLDRI